MARQTRSKKPYAAQNERTSVAKEYTEDARLAAIKPMTGAQKFYCRMLYEEDVVVASGSAGTGKTLLALKTGMEMLRAPNNPIEKIVIIRNFMDSFGESVGALPGTLEEKLSVLHGPLIDNLSIMLPEGYIKQLLASNKIEVIPLSFLRGRSLNNSYIIADELSSVSREAMKLIISRLGKDSKLVLAGDPEQACGSRNDGFDWVTERLEGEEGVGVVYFEKSDIVRNGILSRILQRLED